MKTSWKTTLAGVGGLLTLIGTTLSQLFDGNAATNPDWAVVIPLAFTALVGIFARDNDKSSEDIGVTPEDKVIKEFAASKQKD